MPNGLLRRHRSCRYSPVLAISPEPRSEGFETPEAVQVLHPRERHTNQALMEQIPTQRATAMRPALPVHRLAVA